MLSRSATFCSGRQPRQGRPHRHRETSPPSPAESPVPVSPSLHPGRAARLMLLQETGGSEITEHSMVRCWRLPAMTLVRKAQCGFLTREHSRLAWPGQSPPTVW
ncbi:hypothetical protein BaRGS_00003786 [Batillaria attramentaria]|uniref:Uncharacterized protein n=1 Tax=Batillaria attramentaria TaxID=370345 RepID=A0ABD0LZ60_9CAEN